MDVSRRLSLRALAALALMSPCLASPAAEGEYPPAMKTMGEIIRHDPRFDALIPKDAKLEVLASGFEWTEGPVWIHDAQGGHLLFSDIPRNSVMKWKQGEGASLYLKPSGYTGVSDYGAEPGCNGLLLDPQGRLVSCEHGDRRISVMLKDGGKRTLVDSYRGRRLNSPNDAAYHSNGDLYFTDPPYGLPNRWDDPRRELEFCGVYRLSQLAQAAGTPTPPTAQQGQEQGRGRRSSGTSRDDFRLTLLTQELARPNGIAFSPDEKTLYVAQSDPERAIWMAFPVKEDGTLGEGKVFFDATEHVGKLPGLPDGMKVDMDGNLFATGPGGVYVFAPDATLLGRISTGERTANCAWGNDGTMLYLCADDHICRVQTTTSGNRWKK